MTRHDIIIIIVIIMSVVSVLCIAITMSFKRRDRMAVCVCTTDKSTTCESQTPTPTDGLKRLSRPRQHAPLSQHEADVEFRLFARFGFAVNLHFTRTVDFETTTRHSRLTTRRQSARQERNADSPIYSLLIRRDQAQTQPHVHPSAHYDQTSSKVQGECRELETNLHNLAIS
jgi:hypothetical protein